MRSSIILSLISVAMLAAPPALAESGMGGEVVMPFACAVERGRVRLISSSPKTYSIVGRRSERTMTVCRAPLQGDCPELQVHKFAIACNGVPVSWVRVAAEIAKVGVARSWIENGRLNLMVKVPDSRAPRAPCGENAPSFLHRIKVDSSVDPDGDCWSGASRNAFEHLVMPEGHAPVAEFGAALRLASGGPEAKPKLSPVIVAQRAIPRLSLADRVITIETLPDISPVHSEWAWDAVVTLAATRADVEASSFGLPPTFLSWFAALLLISGAAIGAVRLRQPGLRALVAGRIAKTVKETLDRNRPGPAARAVCHGSVDPELMQAAESVARRLSLNEARVAQFSAIGPLRDVLTGEMTSVRQRLSVAQLVLRDGGPAAMKTAPTFRALMSELDRIERITHSAAASLGGSGSFSACGSGAAIPRTREEAFGVLGVNAQVGELALKKVIDGLRASWHPDLAADDDDRRLREDRMKAINAAADILSGKRSV